MSYIYIYIYDIIRLRIKSLIKILETNTIGSQTAITDPLYEDRHRFSERISILIGAQPSTYLAKRNSLKKSVKKKVIQNICIS